jgi:hypothetical protein
MLSRTKVAIAMFGLMLLVAMQLIFLHYVGPRNCATTSSLPKTNALCDQRQERAYPASAIGKNDSAPDFRTSLRQQTSAQRGKPRERVTMGNNDTYFTLECSSIAEVSDLGVKWFQNKMAKDYTDPSSHCSGVQGLRRCHDVYADTGDGMQLRACQWRFPYGPCEDMRPEYALPDTAVGYPFLQLLCDTCFLFSDIVQSWLQYLRNTPTPEIFPTCANPFSFLPASNFVRLCFDMNLIAETAGAARLSHARFR